METTLIGKILKPFGIKGELRVEVLTDFVEERFHVGSKVLIEGETFEIATARPHQGKLLISFEGYQDINLVEDWRNLEIRYPKEARHQLQENEFYFDDFLGLDVYVDGEKQGVVSDMYDMPAQALMEVKLEDGRKVFVPCVKQFIEEVDIEAQKLTVRWMEGLW